MQIKTFTFNPIQENTYLLYDDTKECIIIDAGCVFPEEEVALVDFIEQNNLTLKRVLNTHSHFDHILGNAFLANKYGVLPEGHEADESFISSMVDHAKSFGFRFEVIPQKMGSHLHEGDVVRFGNTELLTIYVPGHSPGSLCFYCKADGVLFAGDVLFEESVGRADLPGGNFGTLIDGITKKLLILPDQTVVYSGHGNTTTIGHEKQYNPYL